MIVALLLLLIASSAVATDRSPRCQDVPGLFCPAGRSGGQTIHGGTADGDDLTILGTAGNLNHESASNASLVDIKGRVRINFGDSWTTDGSSAVVPSLFRISPTVTVGADNTGPGGYAYSPLVTYSYTPTNGGPLGFLAVDAAGTVNKTGSGADAGVHTKFQQFESHGLWNYNNASNCAGGGANICTPLIGAYQAAGPQMGASGAGTARVGRWYGFGHTSFTGGSFITPVGAGVTVNNYDVFWKPDLSNPPTTTTRGWSGVIEELSGLRADDEEAALPGGADACTASADPAPCCTAADTGAGCTNFTTRVQGVYSNINAFYSNGVLISGKYNIYAPGNAPNDLGGILDVATVIPNNKTGTLNILDLAPNGILMDNTTNGLRGIFFGSTITYESNPTAFGAGTLFNAAPNLINPDGEARTMAAFTVLASNPVFTPNASDNMTAVGVWTANHNPTLIGNTGAHTATNGIFGLRMQGSTDANWTIGDWAGVRMAQPGDGAVSGTAVIDRLGAIRIEPLTAGTVNYSVHSDGTQVFAHEGGGCFGCSQASTTVTGPRGGSILDIVGGLSVKRTTFSNANYTALVTDFIIAQIGTLNNDRFVTLPTLASSTGKIFIIKDESNSVSSTNELIIDGDSSEQIDGFNTQSMRTGRGAVAIYNNGSSWSILWTIGTVTGV